MLSSEDYAERAEKCLPEAARAGREAAEYWIGKAQVFATLAQAAAIREQTQQYYDIEEYKRQY